MSNVSGISEHVEVEQGLGFGGEGAWPHAPLRRAEPEEMSRFPPWFSLGGEGASARREKEPGALPLKGKVLSPETQWHFAGKTVESCISR